MILYDAVFFDFDGVILDSVNIKTKAFAKMFSKYGKEIESKVVDYHLKNGGVSRFEKFKHYYNQFLNKPINDEIIEELNQNFSKLVFEEVLKAPFIDGALETLKKLKSKKIPCYIVSGTPDSEIKKIVLQRNLSEYFVQVYGSPQKKWEITKKIIEKQNYKNKKCLFIGDAMSDYECAKTLGLQFLGIVKKDEKNIFPKGTIINNRIELIT